MARKYDQQAIAAARMILDHPVVGEIFTDMENDALNNAVQAKITDHETAAAWLAEVRAIRKFRDSLRFLITTGENAESRNKAAK